MKRIPFYSKRNQVYPVLRQGRAAVEKRFVQLDDWRREYALYTELYGRLPVPRVLDCQPGVLVLEHRRELTLLDELERQERQGFDPAAWESLAAWLRQCYTLCGRLPEDGSLRNFLWSPSAGQVIGLDLECYYGSYPLERCGARVIAAILTYTPEHTDIKRQAAGTLSEKLCVSEALVREALRTLRARRGQKHAVSFSGIVLAGGRSRRMGRNKAELTLMGKTLLQRQVEKIQALGIRDIMLSGESCPALPGVRVIPDEYTGKGPLGGLHACLRAAQNSACLVVSVDTPLVPAAVLAHLCQAHGGGVTVLRCGGQEEPLLGVYDCRAAGAISALIEDGGYAVRGLREVVPWSDFDYLGPEDLLMNCNTPEEFEAVKSLAQSYASAQLPIG